MKKNLLLMALLCLAIPFVSCSKSDSDNEDEYEYEGSGRVSKTESILVGKWTPYTMDEYDFTYLRDVGWLEFKKNHTYEMHGPDKALLHSGDWELIESSDENESKVLQMKVKKCEDAFLDDICKVTSYKKEEIKSLLVGARLYWEIVTIFSNYMRTGEVLAISSKGDTETLVTKIEWRK